MDPLDARSDVFALGTVLFELVTGELPFGDAHTAATLQRLQACDAREIAVTLTGHGVPRWLIEIIHACLRPLPEDRFGTAADLADALTEELQRLGMADIVLRRQLAAIVGGAMPELEGVHSIESLPPHLGAEDEPMVQRGGSPWRYLAVGAVAALAVMVAARLLEADASDATPPTNAAAPASSGVDRSAAGREGAPRPGTSVPADDHPSKSGPTGESEGPPSTHGDAAGRRSGSGRHRRGSPRVPRELKPNPYSP